MTVPVPLHILKLKLSDVEAAMKEVEVEYRQCQLNEETTVPRSLDRQHCLKLYQKKIVGLRASRITLVAKIQDIEEDWNVFDIEEETVTEIVVAEGIVAGNIVEEIVDEQAVVDEADD